jgi:hypothetical protein
MWDPCAQSNLGTSPLTYLAAASSYQKHEMAAHMRTSIKRHGHDMTRRLRTKLRQEHQTATAHRLQEHSARQPCSKTQLLNSKLHIEGPPINVAGIGAWRDMLTTSLQMSSYLHKRPRPDILALARPTGCCMHILLALRPCSFFGR